MCKKVITSEVLSLHSGSPLSHCFMTSLGASLDSDVPRSHRQLLQRGAPEGWRKLREGTYVLVISCTCVEQLCHSLPPSFVTNLKAMALSGHGPKSPTYEPKSSFPLYNLVILSICSSNTNLHLPRKNSTYAHTEDKSLAMPAQAGFRFVKLLPSASLVLGL